MAQIMKCFSDNLKLRNMTINIKPLGERIVVKPQEAEEKTSSGIYLPDSSKEKQNKGEVVAIGKIEDSEIKVGDTVLYPKFSGTEIEYDDEVYIILDKSDLLAII